MRRLPAPEVSFEAVCAACGTVYWLSAPEAERARLDPGLLAQGRAALEEMTARHGSAAAVSARRARERYARLRPLLDALVLLRRRIVRIVRIVARGGRDRDPGGRG